MAPKEATDWRTAPEAARDTFLRDGYIVLPGFLGDGEVADVRANLDRFIAEVLPAQPRELAFYEDLNRPETLKQIQQMYRHDSFFKGLFLGSKFEQLASVLLDGPVDGINMQYFNKPPQASTPTPPHQDGYYFMIEPCEAVTMWLALDDVDEDNGCVRYVHGSNRSGLRPHGRTQTLGFSQGITDYGTDADKAGEIALSARVGDLLVHHAKTVHRADGNRSESRHRRALGFIYYSQRAKVDDAAVAAYEKRLAEEMKQAGRI